MKLSLFVLLATVYLFSSCTKENRDPIIDNDYFYEAPESKLYSISFAIYESPYFSSKIEDRMFVVSTVGTALTAYKQKEFMDEEAAIEWFNDFCDKWDRRLNKGYDICFILSCGDHQITSRTIQPSDEVLLANLWNKYRFKWSLSIFAHG